MEQTFPQVPNREANRGTRFEWDDTKRQALILLTEGGLTYQQVADRLGVSRLSIWRYRQNPEFASALADLQAMLAAEVQQFAIGRKHERMAAKQERWDAFKRIVEKRREANEGAGQGLDSGFVVKRYKSIGSGPAAYAEVELEFDAGLARAFDNLEKEASIEALQRVEKQEIGIEAQVGVTVGTPSVLRIRDQRPNPYAKNRGTQLPAPGEYVQDESGRWVDAETGEPYQPNAIEAEYREVGSDVEKRIEQLTGWLVQGFIDRPSYDAEVARLRGNRDERS